MIIDLLSKLSNFLTDLNLKSLRFVFTKEKNEIAEMCNSFDKSRMINFDILFFDTYEYKNCSSLRFTGVNIVRDERLEKFLGFNHFFTLKHERSKESNYFFDILVEDSYYKEFSQYERNLVPVVALIDSHIRNDCNENLSSLVEEEEENCNLQNKLVVEFSLEEGMKTIYVG